MCLVCFTCLGGIVSVNKSFAFFIWLLFLCRESLLRSFGPSSNSLTTWRILPSPCKCTTLPTAQLGKVTSHIVDAWTEGAFKVILVLFCVSDFLFSVSDSWGKTKNTTSKLL